MLQEDKELYEFGPFRLDVTEHTFSRSDGAKNGALPEKAFQTLCVLVRNSGRLLTKKALMNHVWPDSFVEENNLDKCIHAIRQVLGEKPGEQTFIETVRKHGYRFVADVSRVETVAEIHEKNSETSEARPNAPEKGSAASEVSAEIAYPPTYNTGKKTPSNPGLRILASAFAALLLGSAIVGYYLYFSGRTADDGRRSIAVLPIKPVNTAIRDEIYEIGIADALIHKLSSVKGFTVRPLSATRKYADIDQDPIAAGNEQQVDYVLASNYQLAAGKIRVISQLFNVATRQIEETYKSESNATDIFAMQDAIVVDIGDALLARFPATTGSPTARGTRNEEAYRLYLQGMYLYDKRSLSNAKKAVELLEQAVQMDSQYALAWAGKAHAHRAVVNHSHYFDDGERETTVHEQYQRSIESINKALALDENLAEAYSALCENRMYYEYDFAGAELACKRAVELNPDSSLAHQIYARYLNTRGRHDEAIA
ncbi:MAG: winged helix-turn-helix domain-containing protein, partial [Saprospiraceae bacterium]|nr:winged helix-turn-helix domain-containing protein [Pyrinomonadaceae bacterium]